MYEGGVREPMMVRAPGVTRAGAVCDSPVVSTDFFPTILELAGLPALPKQHVDGVSFTPLLRGESRVRAPIYWHYPHYGNQGGSPSGAVRDGDWKLIEFYEDGHVELYNLREDPGERHNLADANPERRDELLKRLRDWRESVGAVMPSKRGAG